MKALDIKVECQPVDDHYFAAQIEMDSVVSLGCDDEANGVDEKLAAIRVATGEQDQSCRTRGTHHDFDNRHFVSGQSPGPRFTLGLLLECGSTDSQLADEGVSGGQQKVPPEDPAAWIASSTSKRPRSMT